MERVSLFVPRGYRHVMLLCETGHMHVGYLQCLDSRTLMMQDSGLPCIRQLCVRACVRDQQVGCYSTTILHFSTPQPVHNHAIRIKLRVVRQCAREFGCS